MSCMTLELLASARLSVSSRLSGFGFRLSGLELRVKGLGLRV